MSRSRRFDSIVSSFLSPSILYDFLWTRSEVPLCGRWVTTNRWRWAVCSNLSALGGRLTSLGLTDTGHPTCPKHTGGLWHLVGRSRFSLIMSWLLRLAILMDIIIDIGLWLSVYIGPGGSYGFRFWIDFTQECSFMVLLFRLRMLGLHRGLLEPFFSSSTDTHPSSTRSCLFIVSYLSFQSCWVMTDANWTRGNFFFQSSFQWIPRRYVVVPIFKFFDGQGLRIDSDMHRLPSEMSKTVYCSYLCVCVIV